MAGINDLKLDNIRDIRACFYQGGIWTKNALSEKTGLSLAGTTNVLKYLLDEKEILLCGLAESKVGRKSKQYVLNPDFSHIGCVMASYGQWTHSAYTASYRLSGECVLRRQAEDNTCDMDFLLRMIRDLLSRDPLIRIICVSLPGVVKDGVIGYCDIAGLENTDAGKVITEEFGLPCVIENDVNAAAMGFAAEKRTDGNIALIYQPEISLTGCGILIDGRLYHGSASAAGEIKHMSLAGTGNARSVLLKQMKNLCAVLNPSVIAWYSDVIQDEKITADMLDVPEMLKCQIIRARDFYKLLAEGLFTMGMQGLVSHSRRKKKGDR